MLSRPVPAPTTSGSTTSCATTAADAWRATRCPRRSAGSSGWSAPPPASPTTPGPGRSRTANRTDTAIHPRNFRERPLVGPLVGGVSPGRGRPPATSRLSGPPCAAAGRGSPRRRRPCPTRWEGTFPAAPRPRQHQAVDAGTQAPLHLVTVAGSRAERRQHATPSDVASGQVVELQRVGSGGRRRPLPGRCAPRRATASAAARATRCSQPARPPSRGVTNEQPGGRRRSGTSSSSSG